MKPTPRLFDWVDELDSHDRIALVASHAESGVPLGLARAVRDGRDTTRAEVAVTVVDGWQRRGVGSALVDELACHALAEGITAFSGTAFAENRGARALAARLGDAHFGLPSGGVLSFEVPIACRYAPVR